MANPQIEDGHTKIANDLFEKIISSGLNGTELSVILFLIRKTYGFQKKQDYISLNQFMACIPVSRPTICKALKNLQLVKIIKLVKKGNSINMANLYALSKNFDTWQLVKKSKLVKFSKSTSKDFEKQLVKKTLPTKETITKETLQKKSFGENSMIKLSTEEYAKLCRSYGGRYIDRLIQAVEDWKRSKGKDYKDDYAGIRTWIRRRKEDGKFILKWEDFREEDFENKEDYEKSINKYL